MIRLAFSFCCSRNSPVAVRLSGSGDLEAHSVVRNVERFEFCDLGLKLLDQSAKSFQVLPVVQRDLSGGGLRHASREGSGSESLGSGALRKQLASSG